MHVRETVYLLHDWETSEFSLLILRLQFPHGLHILVAGPL